MTNSQSKALLDFDSPAMTWDNAMPLGNGLLGGLVWGDGQPLKISVDKADLWDLRDTPQFHSKDYNYEKMKQWVAQKQTEHLQRLYEDPYTNNPGPTKIPAGRIEICFGKDLHFKNTDLDILNAISKVNFCNGITTRVLIHAIEPVGIIEVNAIKNVEIKLKAPDYKRDALKSQEAEKKQFCDELSNLDYDPPEIFEDRNSISYLQKGWGDFQFAVAIYWHKSDILRAAFTVTTSLESDDPLALAKQRCKTALNTDFETLIDEHQRWWANFWAQSNIRIPDQQIQKQWYMDMYKLGSTMRSHTPPVALQGLWTADEGKIPPWKGDYHHDLNTELCYWPCYSSNHLQEGLGLINWLWETMPNAKIWTRHFFNKPGLNVPGTADLKNNQLGGWCQYTHSATTSAWLAHHFYMHWRYSMDKSFLEEKAYPFVKEVAVFLESIPEVNESEMRTLKLSSSPEINDNRLDAWFASITNYDLSLIRSLFSTAVELAEVLKKKEEKNRWKIILNQLPELAVDPQTKGLTVAQGYRLTESHRHFSHLMAIYPLGLLDSEEFTTSASLEDLSSLGTSQWVGYSFAWHACLAARAQKAEKAVASLKIFSEAFCLRNSFHCNGDQSGKGYSDFTYKPFTLEGNFAAATALQEMMLQSHGDKIEVFPAIPNDWKEVSFTNLRAEGAFLISAVQSEGLTQLIEIFSEIGGQCRIKDPFSGSRFITKGIADNFVRKTNDHINIQMISGEKITLVMA